MYISNFRLYSFTRSLYFTYEETIHSTFALQMQIKNLISQNLDVWLRFQNFLHLIINLKDTFLLLFKSVS